MDTEIRSGFVIANDFNDVKGGKHTGYYQGIRMGFQSWGSDTKRAKLFDTRAIAARCARTLQQKTRIVAVREEV